MGDKINGVLELKSFYDLYLKVEHDCQGLSMHDSYSVFNLLCTLNHLREWGEKDSLLRTEARAECRKISEKIKNESDAKESELFSLYVIRRLCNSAKHFKPSDKTFLADGAICGLVRCGDRLGRNYYFYDSADGQHNVERVIEHSVLFWRKFVEKYKIEK